MINVEMNMHRSTRFVILSEQSEAKDDKWRGSAYSLSRGEGGHRRGSGEEFGKKSESQYKQTDLLPSRTLG